jgi:hypothetical protein
MKREPLYGMLFIGLIGVGTARANLLLDTGSGPNTPIGYIVSGPNSPYGPLGVQSLAGEFTTNQVWDIGSIQGWMAAFPGDFPPGPVDLNVSIYSNAPAGPYVYGGSSQPGSALFTAAFQLSLCASAAQFSCPVGWQGANGLSWQLNPGSYWVVFEGSGSDTGWAEMPGGVPAPLENSLFLSGSNQGLWSELYPGGFGVEISGVTSVSEPATLALFGLGLAGVGLSRRRLAG